MTTMPAKSNHARPDDGAMATSQILAAIQASPTINNVRNILRFTLLLIRIGYQ